MSVREECDELIIPENVFEPPKKFVSVTIPFCERNEDLAKKFMAKFHSFTENKFSQSSEMADQESQEFVQT